DDRGAESRRGRLAAPRERRPRSEEDHRREQLGEMERKATGRRKRTPQNELDDAGRDHDGDEHAVLDEPSRPYKRRQQEREQEKCERARGEREHDENDEQSATTDLCRAHG